MAKACSNMTHADLSALLNRQRAAFLRDGPPDLARRKAHLKTLRAAIIARRTELENAISADFGHRSRHETALMELLGMIQGIDYYRRKLRGFMKPQRRHVSPVYWPAKAFIAYQPLGIVGIMAPWNYPVSLAINPLTAALAAGNRAMIKPSEATARTSAVIQQMIADCFAPEEVAVVLGGPEVGAAFSALPFDHLLFTGSTEIGRSVMRAASENLVPVTLELGGKSPTIVARGHVNDRTLSALAFGKFANAGQTCVAPDYLYVHRDDIGEFANRFGTIVEQFYPNGPAGDDYSSIVNDRHFDRLNALIDDARDKGGTVMTIGARPQTAAERPRTLPPTLVLNASRDMRVMREEIFGPIMPILPYDRIDEVIDHVNSGPRPLALYYFGEDGAECRAIMQRTTSGGFGVNNTLLHAGQDDLPFGGVGASGMGAYHGIEGFRAMSHGKAVFVQPRWSLLNLLHAPFGRLADLALGLTLR